LNNPKNKIYCASVLSKLDQQQKGPQLVHPKIIDNGAGLLKFNF